MAAKLLKSYELQVMICDLLKITSICYVFTGGKNYKNAFSNFQLRNSFHASYICSVVLLAVRLLQNPFPFMILHLEIGLV